MSKNTTAKSSESTLVVEKGKAQHAHAQFTRIQMALGLKESLKPEDLEKLVYGVKLRATEETGESDSTYSTQASAGTRFDQSTAQTPITITISDVPTAAIPSSPSKAVPNRTVQDVVSQYHLDQKLLEKQLYACRHSMLVPADRFESLFNHDIYRKQCWCISLKNYPRVFEMIGRISVSETDTQIAETLRSVISGREEAQKFYQSLDASDEGHQNMIDVLKAGEAVLLWKTRSLKASD